MKAVSIPYEGRERVVICDSWTCVVLGDMHGVAVMNTVSRPAGLRPASYTT